MDGVGDSDFDNDDDDVEVVEPYSVDTPSLRAPMSVTTPHSVFSRTPGSAVQSVKGGNSTDVGGGGESAMTTTPDGGGGNGEGESDDDEADMVVATPGVIGSIPTPNPASVVTAASITPATPHTMPTSTTTSTAVTHASTSTTAKRSHDTITPGGGSGLPRDRLAKRPRISALVGKEFREFDDELDDDLADDEEEDEEVDVDDEEEEEFGSAATMAPSGQRCVAVG